VRGKRTQGRWGAGRIRNLVVNPVYRGELQYGRRAEPKPHTPKEPVISAAVEALVTSSVWHAAQETLARNRSLPKNTTRTYLLRGVLRCARCGHAFCGTTAHGETWYRCDGALRRADLLGDRCPATGVKGTVLEPLVWADIEAWLANQAELVRELEAEAASHPARRALAEERARWDTALTERTAQRERVLDLYQQGYLARAEFEERLAVVETARGEILAQIERLTEDDTLADEDAFPPDLVSELRRRLSAGLSHEDRQEIVRLLVRRITVHTTVAEDGKKTQRAVIEYRFGGGETHTGTAASLNYTLLCRTMDLPSGRQKKAKW
jgi:site-specific DNA recombinase